MSKIDHIEQTELKNFMADVDGLLEKEEKLDEDKTNLLSRYVSQLDHSTLIHLNQTEELAKAIAYQMRLSFPLSRAVRLGAKLHDIGKTHVAPVIVTKPSSLNEGEQLEMRQHVRYGYGLIRELMLPNKVATVALQHHRMLDGSGFPSYIDPREIFLETKIVTVADVMEAMTGQRPYRTKENRHTLGEALEEITKWRNRLYDPQVVDACLEIFSGINCRYIYLS